MKYSIHRLIFFILFLPISAFAEKDSITPSAVDNFSMMSMLNMMMGLVAVIALILGLAWILKRYGKLPGKNSVEMKVLGGLSLGTREKALLIEVENVRLLVGVTPGHIQTLHVLNNHSEQTDSIKEQPSFNSSLEKVLKSNQSPEAQNEPKQDDLPSHMDTQK